jgi:hypothetical protein
MATMLAYGFFGDVIHQSDKWRHLGPLRYDLAGFYQFIRNRSYHSEVTITLPAHNSPQISHPQLVTPMKNINNGTITSLTPDSHQLLNHQIKTSFQVIDKLVTPGLVFCSKNCETCAIEEMLGSDQVHSPSQIKREGKYTTINCLNMPCRCAKSRFGISPFVHLGEIID